MVGAGRPGLQLLRQQLELIRRRRQLRKCLNTSMFPCFKTKSQVDDSQWQPLWQFCNADGSDALSSDELTSCGARAANYLGMPQAHQNFLYEFAGKYWSVIDQDGSGDLSYDEYRYTFGGFAATDAGVIMAAFDNNSNGVLDAEELSNWKSTIQNLMNQWGWNPSDATKACLKDAWSAADSKSTV